MRNTRLLTILGAFVGAAVIFLLYYFTTYRPLGGSWFRALLLPSVFGGFAGGMLVHYLCSRRQRAADDPADDQPVSSCCGGAENVEDITKHGDST